MHYKDGTPAKVGDLAMQTETMDEGHQLVGVIAKLYRRAESCNAQLIPLAIRQRGVESWMPFSGAGQLWHVTLAECNKIDALLVNTAQDAMAAANTS